MLLKELKNHQGVTIPSQRRYVEYFHRLLISNQLVKQYKLNQTNSSLGLNHTLSMKPIIADSKPLYLRSVIIYSIPIHNTIVNKANHIYFTIEQPEQGLSYTMKEQYNSFHDQHCKIHI